MMDARRVAALYMVLRGTSSLFVAVVYTVELIYQAQRVGLNPFQLVLAGMVKMLVSFLCQTPMGALADLYSRRWAVVSGLLLIGSGFFLEGVIPALAAVLVAQMLWGLGSSLMEGADAAWVADELDAQQVGSLYLRATQLGWFCTLPGIALGAALGSVQLSWPMFVGAGGYFALGVLLAVLMPERRSMPAPGEGRPSWREMQQTLVKAVQLVRFQPVLLSILLIGAFSSITGEGFGRLWQYHLLHTFTFPTLGGLAPIAWFGVMETGIALTSILGIEIMRRSVSTTNQRAVAWGLFLAEGIRLLSIGLFALAGQFALAVAALWLLTAASGPQTPLIQAWMNLQIPSSIRATVLSLYMQVGFLAAMPGGLLIGGVATALTPRVALLLSGLLLLPSLFLYARMIRKQIAAQ